MDNSSSDLGNPASPKSPKRLRWILGGILLALLLPLLLSLAYVGVIHRQIDRRLEQLRTSRSSRFLAVYPALAKGQEYSTAQLRFVLEDQGLVERPGQPNLRPGEYRWEGATLHLYRPEFSGPGMALTPLQAEITLSPTTRGYHIDKVVRADTKDEIEVEGVPRQIGTYFAGRLRNQNSVPLSEIPTSVRLAVMAIEDVHFLEHFGVSFRGTLRALYHDLREGRFAQGGSTLTQQLMKNLFFSREKAISRKFKEALYAFVGEATHSKEDLLEAYLNEVYMGQWGAHEIHGVSEGARYFFSRPVSQLSLAQSATLAAIVQAPNAMDPRRNPERTIKRRNLVLKKMFDEGFILEDEFKTASEEPLGSSAEAKLDDVDYFIEHALESLPASTRKQLDADVVTIYVTLNPYLQSSASKTLAANLTRLEGAFKALQDKTAAGKQLQSALIAVDVKNCSIVALQGGSSYRRTQFNRILSAKRQPGSLFKPFAYLAAFADAKPPITPSTILEDAPLEWKYDQQTWNPKNYDETFRGPVTARQALELSLNVPTARLAQLTGLDAITRVIAKAGVHSKVPKVPSIVLGSADVTPIELAQAFTTLASGGRACSLRSFVKAFDQSGNLLTENPVEFTQTLPEPATFVTNHVLRGVLTHGTAKSAITSGIAPDRFAGKTGTTSEYKDAWFIGYSPSFLTLVWVGYDEDKVGLSGGVAALPLWTEFIKLAEPFIAPAEFIPPDGVQSATICRSTGKPAEATCPDPITEYYVSGTRP